MHNRFVLTDPVLSYRIPNPIPNRIPNPTPNPNPNCVPNPIPDPIPNPVSRLRTKSGTSALNLAKLDR